MPVYSLLKTVFVDSTSLIVVVYTLHQTNSSDCSVAECTVLMSNDDSCIARPILPLFQLHYAVHGGWSSWLEVTSCSVSCGGGTKFLVRECNNPVPAHGGNDCDGVSYRVERCNTCPCEPRDWDIVTVIYY